MKVTFETYHKDWLLAELQRGAQLKYLFFWGHRAKKGESTGAFGLSQWWPAAFEMKGIHYPTAEHWMMAGKARLFGDEAMLTQILHAKTPGEAKKWGRGVKQFETEKWEAVSFDLVTVGSILKFNQHPQWMQYLLGTGDRVLVEASPVDAIWGNGHAAEDPVSVQPSRWRGQNRLGFALMEAREHLRRHGPLSTAEEEALCPEWI